MAITDADQLSGILMPDEPGTTEINKAMSSGKSPQVRNAGAAPISNDPYAGISIDPNVAPVSTGNSPLVVDSFDKALQSMSASPTGGGISPFSTPMQQKFQSMLEYNELPIEFRDMPGLSTADDATLEALIAQHGRPSIGVPLPSTTGIDRLISGLGAAAPTEPVQAIDPTLISSPESVAALAQLMPGKFSQSADTSKLIEMLQQQAAGKAPSVAELAAKQQHDKNLRAQMALAASQSGRALPTTQRQLLQQQALGGQQLAQDLAITRAGEMQSALGQLGTTLGDVGQQKSAFEATQADVRLGQAGFESDKARADAAAANAAAQQALALQAAAIQAQKDRQAQAIANKLASETQIATAKAQFDADKEAARAAEKAAEKQSFIDAAASIGTSILAS
jgi:hypothetical protein